jgi:uncharacterized protein (TIGR00297 family)
MVDVATFLTPAKLLQVLAVAAVGVYTYRKDMLNAAGAFTAFTMGALIVLFTNLFWLLLLFALLGLGSAATRFRYAEKESAKVSEKAGGRRSTRNVIANGATPAVLAVAAPFLGVIFSPNVAAIAYVSAIAVAASDTLASEFGSLAKRVYLITTLKPVPAGVDGGVSFPGQMAALAGAALISALGAIFLGLLTPGELRMSVNGFTLLIPVLCGFVGCQIDSVLGATLEGDGLFTKEETNLVSISAGAVLALVISVAADV